MKKFLSLLALTLVLAAPAYATTQSLLPDQGVGDSLDFMAYDTDDHDFVAFARLQSNTVPFFNIYPNTKFNGLTMSETLSSYATNSAMESAMAAMIDTAPSSLNTLAELAGALGNDASFAITVANDLSNKVDKVSGKGLSANDYTSAEKSKLAGIAAGATANDTDANLKARANHTGTQAISTVSGLQAALDAKFPIPSGTTSQYVRGDGSLATLPTSSCYSGTTQKSGCFPVIKSATVSSGVAVFHLTSDGTSGGAALFSNGVDQDSVQLVVNDATASYQYGWAFSNSNKTLTVTANKLTTANILTGLLGQAQANGSVVKLTVFGN